MTTVTFKVPGGDVVTTLEDGETVLEASERKRRELELTGAKDIWKIQAGCRHGTCSLCRCRSYVEDDPLGTYKKILACQTKPTVDIVVIPNLIFS